MSLVGNPSNVCVSITCKVDIVVCHLNANVALTQRRCIDFLRLSRESPRKWHAQPALNMLLAGCLASGRAGYLDSCCCPAATSECPTVLQAIFPSLPASILLDVVVGGWPSPQSAGCVSTFILVTFDSEWLSESAINFIFSDPVGMPFPRNPRTDAMGWISLSYSSLLVGRVADVLASQHGGQATSQRIPAGWASVQQG